MKDEKLYRISLALSVAGLAALFLLAHVSSPERLNIGEIDHGDIGNRVEVRGTAEDVYVSDGGHIFFHVKENGSKIDVVVFEDDVKSMGLEYDTIDEGNEVVVSGDVDLYRGDLQILPNELEIK